VTHNFNVSAADRGNAFYAITPRRLNQLTRKREVDMFGLGKVTCIVCRGQVSEKQALRGRHRKEIGACRICYDSWERSGRSCADCHSPVQGAQEAGVFPDRHAFGHADCGAVWLSS
jgi:hypothetical protein